MLIGIIDGIIGFDIYFVCGMFIRLELLVVVGNVTFIMDVSGICGVPTRIHPLVGLRDLIFVLSSVGFGLTRCPLCHFCAILS